MKRGSPSLSWSVDTQESSAALLTVRSLSVHTNSHTAVVTVYFTCFGLKLVTQTSEQFYVSKMTYGQHCLLQLSSVGKVCI